MEPAGDDHGHDDGDAHKAGRRRLVNDQHLITSFGTIDLTGKRESACIAWQIHRLGSSDAENNDVRLLEFDIHYVAGKPGTEYEISEA